jgi:mannose-6-phosphate isomerase-like protein (cupin superfamily)
MSKRANLGLKIAFILALVACSPAFVNVAAAQTAPTSAGVFDVDSLLMAYPLAADQQLRSEQIAHDSLSSVQLTQIRGELESHRHLSHDENIWVIRGAGRLVLDGVKQKVTAGQMIHIPKGVSHSFHNMGSQPAVVISVFSPGFDGKDRIYDNPTPH